MSRRQNHDISYVGNRNIGGCLMQRVRAEEMLGNSAEKAYHYHCNICVNAFRIVYMCTFACVYAYTYTDTYTNAYRTLKPRRLSAKLETTCPWSNGRVESEWIHGLFCNQKSRKIEARICKITTFDTNLGKTWISIRMRQCRPPLPACSTVPATTSGQPGHHFRPSRESKTDRKQARDGKSASGDGA